MLIILFYWKRQQQQWQACFLSGDFPTYFLSLVFSLWLLHQSLLVILLRSLLYVLLSSVSVMTPSPPFFKDLQSF